MPAVEQDLTQGSVTRKLVRYALPLVASSLLQAIKWWWCHLHGKTS